MKKFLALVAALLMMFLAIVPMTFASAAGSTMYVSSSNGKGVRMRDEPSKSGKVVYTLGEGTKVNVIEMVDNNWAYVTAQGYASAGYVMRRFLSTSSSTDDVQTFRNVSHYTVTVKPSRAGGYVNLRAAASKSSACLSKMRAGTTLTVIAQSRSWFKVIDASGTTGYVVKAFVTR